MARLRQCSENRFWCKPCADKGFAHLLAKMLKAMLLWQQEKAVAQTKDRERRAGSETKILAKLLGDRQLPFFANLRRRQIFENC